MVLLCTIVFADACWGLKRESDILTDSFGTKVITELDSLNMIIQDRIEPWAPYSVDLDAVRDELATSFGVNTIAWVSIGLHVLKILITLQVAICNVLLVRDQS